MIVKKEWKTSEGEKEWKHEWRKKKKRKRKEKPNIMIERKKKETWKRGKINRENANIIREVKKLTEWKKKLNRGRNKRKGEKTSVVKKGKKDLKER